MYVTSAAGRRWGPGVSGWLTGLPLLAGPVSVFVCIEQGETFASYLLGLAACLAINGLTFWGLRARL